MKSAKAPELFIENGGIIFCSLLNLNYVKTRKVWYFDVLNELSF